MKSNINDLVSQALESNPSVTVEKVQNCVVSCVGTLNKEQVLFDPKNEYVLLILNTIVSYLTDKNMDNAINAFMPKLSSTVKNLSKGDVKLNKTSKEYKIIQESVRQEILNLEQTGNAPQAQMSHVETTEEATSETPVNPPMEAKEPAKKIRAGRAKAEKRLASISDEDTPSLDDLEKVEGADIYIGKTGTTYEGKAYVKRGGQKYYFLLIFSILPSKVVRLYSPGAYKGQSTQFRATINDQTETFTSDDLKFGRWYELFKKNVGVNNVPANGQYAQIIGHLADREPLEHLFIQTGLHEVDNVWGYLLPNGQFFTGGKEYSTPVNFAHKVKGDLLETWNDWSEQASLWDENAAIEAVKYCIGLSPVKGQVAVSLAHHTRTLSSSVRNSKLDTGYLFFVKGLATSGKTSSTCLTANVGKPSFFHGKLECEYKGTKTSIESIIDAFSDIPFIIDDYEPDGTPSDKIAGEKLLTSLAKSSYSRTPIRPRMNGDMTSKKDNYVYTFPTTTSTIFPSDLSEGVLRRTIFMQIMRGDVPTESGDYNLTYAHDFHKEGLAKLGRKIILMHVDALNTKGMKEYVSERVVYFKEYKQNIRKLVTSMWQEKGHGDVPGIADNLLTIAANITLGARDVDSVTHSACELASFVQGPLARIIYEQLLLMEGIRSIEGESLLNDAFKSLFDSIVEGKTISNVLYKVVDYKSKEGKSPDIKITVNGKEYRIPTEQWEGPENNRFDKTIAAYVDYIGQKPSESILYLTSAGRDALLYITKNTEGLEHIKTKTKLGQIVDKEGWIIKRNKNNVDVPCNPRYENKQVRSYALSFEKMLNIIFDMQSFIEACEEIEKVETSEGKDKPKKASVTTRNNTLGSVKDANSMVDSFSKSLASKAKEMSK